MVQVLSSRSRRRSKKERAGDFIHQHQSGIHQGKYFVKVPRERTETGAQLYKRFGPFPEIERAVEARDEYLATVAKDGVGAVPLGRKAKPMTLGEWVPIWLDTLKNDVSHNTHSKYERAFKHHILPHLGKLALKELTRTRVQQWRETLKGETGPQMVNYCLKRLRTCLNAAALDPTTTSLTLNPATRVKLVPITIERNVGSPSDYPLLLEAAGEHYLAGMIQVAVDTGLRCSELVALHWKDIDFERRTVSLRWHTVSSGEVADATAITAMRPYTKAAAHAGKVEYVHLSERAIEALRQTRERLLVHKVAAGRAWKAGKASEVFYAGNASARTGKPYIVPERPTDDEALVFPAADGMPQPTNTLASWFARVTKKAGVEKGMHDMRHDCGSFMLAQGVPLTVVSEHLRHKSPAITAQIYLHVLEEQVRLGADTLDKLWAQMDAQALAV